MIQILLYAMIRTRIRFNFHSFSQPPPPQRLAGFEDQTNPGTVEVASRNGFQLGLLLIVEGRMLEKFAACKKLLDVQQRSHIQASLICQAGIWTLKRNRGTGIDGGPSQNIWTHPLSHIILIEHDLIGSHHIIQWLRWTALENFTILAPRV